MTDPSASPHQSLGQTSEAVLDAEHLGRMTHGDRALEREVLQLFDRQAAMLADRLRDAPAEIAASCAHTLKGSARGIGAWRVARAAERVEGEAEAGARKLTEAVGRLVGEIAEARTAIALRLQA